MNQEWLDCLMKLPLEDYSSFMEHSHVTGSIELSKKFMENDYSWLNVVEKYLPFLKNTMESPYTLLLEDDLKKNYESRFLYTLFSRLEDFLEKQYQVLLEEEAAPNQSVLHLEGKTSLEEEEVSMELSLQVTKKETNSKNPTTIHKKERLEQTLAFLKPLKECPFMKRMEGCSQVRSPIRSSALLSRHENYKKLLELFEFLDSYAVLEKSLSLREKKRQPEEFLIPYFMNYALFSQTNFFKETDLEFLKKYLEVFIRRFVEQSSMDEKAFKKMVNKLFEEEYAKKKNRQKNIQAIFKKSLETEQKQIKDAIRLLKG